MDAQGFDRVVKSLATGASRRRVLRGFGGGALAGALALAGSRRGQAEEIIEEEVCLETVFICHRTHSARNPWNYIEVCVDSLPAHAEHGDVICANLEVLDPETCTCSCPTDIDCGDGFILNEVDCVCEAVEV